VKSLAIINPRSAGGRTGRAARTIARALERTFAPLSVTLTAGPGDAERLARQALREGVERVVAVGGDGTVGEVVNGFFEHGAASNPDAELAVVELGTGGDFRRTFDLPGRLHPALDRIANGTVRAIDVGRVRHATPTGGTAERYFANIASLGLTAGVAARANGALALRRYAGGLVFVWAALSELLRHRHRRLRLILDDTRTEELDVVLAAACNGRYFGGGMHVAPEAHPDDGLLDIVVVVATSTPHLLGAFLHVFRGSHVGLACVRQFRARSLTVEPVGTQESEVGVELDGETPGALLPSRFEVVPQAIRLRC
jgi:YegS/Rv2252/BmrU family lipid kinase